MMRILLCCLILIVPMLSMSQMVFWASIKDSGDSSIMASANIINLDTRQRALSDAQGVFRIGADFKDRLVITAVGYLPDTLIVQPQLFLRAPVIYLAKQFSALKSVTVYADQYSVDSLATREWYDSIRRFNNPKVINRRHPDDPLVAGITFSPITYFSAKARAKRKLIKWMDYTEKEDYISYRFPAHLVARYTGLNGDSLRTFLLKYRPTYAFCTKASDEDILFYVNDCLKEYLHQPSASSLKKRR